MDRFEKHDSHWEVTSSSSCYGKKKKLRMYSIHVTPKYNGITQLVDVVCLCLFVCCSHRQIYPAAGDPAGQVCCTYDEDGGSLLAR